MLSPQLAPSVLKSAAAVLTVPRRIVRTAGPILAVATGPDDPSTGTRAQDRALEQVIDGFNRSMLGARECLRVMTRGRQATDARRLFSALHGIPLLVIEPDQADGAVEQRSESGSVICRTLIRLAGRLKAA